MNTSLAHLPREARKNLSRLVDCIKNEVPDIQYIILFGSYARGDYVDYDQRVEYGIRTCFQSDFDIVALTSKKEAYGEQSINSFLRNASTKYAKGYARPKVPPVEFLTESVEEFNANIAEGKYFYTDIVKEGIILYNSGKYELEPLRELNCSQILKLAKMYYEVNYNRAERLLKGVKFGYNEGIYEESSFILHQATENYLLAIILTASLYSKKNHNIIDLLEKTKLFTMEAVEVFDIDAAEGDRLLKLLQSAYIQSRYDKDFVILKEDLKALIEKIEHLRVVTEKFCLETIAEHEKRTIL